ncbi:hypothetical protein SKAU_G00414940 [Synaphobranchus kaupii]|uniref:Uncharacterized protein n=1 Tax=Synaphobranchus kaupii TaxID=118154 RepID=A0A9Q1E787_SYNKA|nr:hypothetical protein SKAU_G00414940 [Synaphobranchus kaupii]
MTQRSTAEPSCGKVEAIQGWLRPRTKKQVRGRTWECGCHVQERCTGRLDRPSFPVGAEGGEGVWQPAGAPERSGGEWPVCASPSRAAEAHIRMSGSAPAQISADDTTQHSRAQLR